MIAVAACNDSGTRSAYSDMGRGLWCAFPSNHGEPSLTPGIWTTDRSGPRATTPATRRSATTAGDYTNSFGGTSSACPGVAGVAALMLAVNPELDLAARCVRCCGSAATASTRPAATTTPTATARCTATGA